LDDDIEDHAPLAGGEVDLVSVLHVTAALDDEIGRPLEEPDQFLAGRQRLTLEYPTLALREDAPDQRRTLVDLAALTVRPRSRRCRSAFGGLSQRRLGGAAGGDQLTSREMDG
jgi:hypothetical protein